MPTKYLKAFKNGAKVYWWLVEAHRENNRVIVKKLKYWGANKPEVFYATYIMPLDDNRPLTDLTIMWRVDTGRWHWQRRGDFEYWFKRGQEIVFWDSLNRYVCGLPEKSEILFTRASNRSEATRNVRNDMKKAKPELTVAVDLVSWKVIWRMLFPDHR